jgi:hypothetical protein
LSDGQFVNEHIELIESQPKKVVDDVEGLPSESNRYEMVQSKYSASQDYILIDQVTGEKHCFIRQPKDSHYSCELNRLRTYCLKVQYVFGYKINVLLETMFMPSPPSIAAHLISLMQVIRPSTDQQKIELFSVMSVPEKRLVTPPFVNRNMAVREYQHDRFVIRALSPSGRWIVVGDDSENTPGSKRKGDWTSLYFYDTASLQWHGYQAELDILLSGIEFLSDELLLVTSTRSKRLAVHLPTGKVIDEIRDEVDMVQVKIRTDSITGIPPEAVQKGLKYIKLEDNEVNGSDLMLRTVDQSGKMSVAKKREFTFQLEGCLACGGSQVYCKSVAERPLPKWIKGWLPKGMIHDLIKNWLNRQIHFVYDFGRDQIETGWPKNTSASVSEDGSILVIKDLRADHSVQRFFVYDLPLPVWLPWWSRGTGFVLVLLLCLLLVRRRSAGQPAIPSSVKP